jgi:hypothetical protein
MSTEEEFFSTGFVKVVNKSSHGKIRAFLFHCWLVKGTHRPQPSRQLRFFIPDFMYISLSSQQIGFTKKKNTPKIGKQWRVKVFITAYHKALSKQLF